MAPDPSCKARPPAPRTLGAFVSDLWLAYRLRWRRRRLLARAIRSRHDLSAVSDRTGAIRPGAILLVATIRNEAERLPFWLSHYRRLGVTHFLIVDNASTDGSTALLASAPDISLWTTSASYKGARFGMDWATLLLLRHGHGHWTLTVDADELLIYPHWETRPLPALTDWLDGQNLHAMGAMMLDLYPQGPLDHTPYAAGKDPTKALPWFDAGNYVMRVQSRLRNLWIQGGPRARAFFAADPRRAPTLGKVPLVRWHWRYAWESSTHQLLPRRLNACYETDGGERISGVLLHTKFLNTIVAKSAEEKARGEHFANSALYHDYYNALTQAPDLWTARSTRYQGWRQLEALGLLSRGGWI